MSWIPIAAAGVAGAIAAVFLVPRILLRRAQDRLASRLLAESGESFQLLTRAELVTGLHRRIPGVLGLAENVVSFAGLFGEKERLPTSAIRKIVTGRKLASGRTLWRLEILRFSRPGDEDLEFVLAPSSAAAWRSHLGLWAVAERKSAMDILKPGR